MHDRCRSTILSLSLSLFLFVMSLVLSTSFLSHVLWFSAFWKKIVESQAAGYGVLGRTSSWKVWTVRLDGLSSFPGKFGEESWFSSVYLFFSIRVLHLQLTTVNWISIRHKQITHCVAFVCVYVCILAHRETILASTPCFKVKDRWIETGVCSWSRGHLGKLVVSNNPAIPFSQVVNVSLMRCWRLIVWL